MYFDKDFFPFQQHPTQLLVKEESKLPLNPSPQEQSSFTPLIDDCDEDLLTPPSDPEQISSIDHFEDVIHTDPHLTSPSPNEDVQTPSASPPPPTNGHCQSGRQHNQTDQYVLGANCSSLYQPATRVIDSLLQAQILHKTFWCDSNSFIDHPSSVDAYAIATTETVCLIDEPQTYSEAMRSPKSSSWKTAGDKEVSSIKEKGV